MAASPRLSWRYRIARSVGHFPRPPKIAGKRWNVYHRSNSSPDRPQFPPGQCILDLPYWFPSSPAGRELIARSFQPVLFLLECHQLPPSKKMPGNRNSRRRRRGRDFPFLTYIRILYNQKLSRRNGTNKSQIPSKNWHILIRQNRQINRYF